VSNFWERGPNQEKKYLQAALQIIPIYLSLRLMNDNTINSANIGGGGGGG